MSLSLEPSLKSPPQGSRGRKRHKYGDLVESSLTTTTRGDRQTDRSCFVGSANEIHKSLEKLNEIIIQS